MLISKNTKIYGFEKEVYKIISEINTGGFGIVYKIEKEKDKSIYALKTILNSLNKDNIEAFLNETKMISKVEHKNIIKYYFVHDGSLYPELPPYIIMEYANQGTLQNIIQKHRETKKHIEKDILANYITQLIDGIEAIDSTLIHRDIKPNNILVCDEILKITDFGLSKMAEEATRTLTFKGFGQQMYMSPECWKGDKNNIQMDIYSMGIIFYQLVTLEYPYKVENQMDIENWKKAHLYQTPELPEKIVPDIDLKISQVIMKMLEKSISKRYKNWADIRKDLNKDVTKTTGNPFLKEVITSRLEKDNKLTQEQLAQAKKDKDIQDNNELIHYQFIEGIVHPIKSIIDEINEGYIKGKITFDFSDKPNNKLRGKIVLISGVTLYIEIELLYDDNFYRDIPNGWGGTMNKLSRPVLNGEKITAWGFIKSYENAGYNLILVENKNDMYGTWHMLINKNSVFGRNPRNPEPFPFEFREIEKEIGYIHITHIYTTVVKSFDINEIIGLIKHYN
ncbi:MAG: serine/threonine-protein kinase [Ignavibacteria bacterium]|nr:serine/threonine-protein kinase [Ignavibacteria bacterium]